LSKLLQQSNITQPDLVNFLNKALIVCKPNNSADFHDFDPTNLTYADNYKCQQTKTIRFVTQDKTNKNQHTTSTATSTKP